MTRADGRTAVVLQAGERDFVLSEMRGMLAATQGIIEGINQNDMQRIIRNALLFCNSCPSLLKH